MQKWHAPFESALWRGQYHWQTVGKNSEARLESYKVKSIMRPYTGEVSLKFQSNLRRS